MAWMDDLWHEVVGDAAASLDWLKQVVLGEFDDHQSTSALIAQLLASFVPGVVIVMSARDMTAVLIRMVRHPDKRESVTEWMILVACAIGLVPALVGAVAGAAAAGVGAIVGGLAGDEAGAALRATALLLIEDGARMLEKLVEFLRRFVKGDIFRFLRAVKFAEYAEPVAKELSKFIGHLNSIIEKVIARASHFTWFTRVGNLIEKLRALEAGFREVDRMAARQIKSVMAEFDVRLQRALGTKMAQADHVVHPNTPAPHPTPKPPAPKRVAARADHPLGKPPGLEPADPLPPKTPPDKNLHPQGVEETPSAAKAKVLTPGSSAADVDALKAANPAEVKSASTFTPQGMSTDDAKAYLATPEGQAYTDELAKADPSADSSEIGRRALSQLSTGTGAPTSIMQTDPLVKVVPTGTTPSAYSPFFTTQSELNNAIASGKPLGDSFGLPLSSQAQSYDVYQMTPKDPSGALVMQSEVAPTTELNGAFNTTGGGQQYIVPNRGSWNTPTQVGTIPSTGGSPFHF